MSKTSFRLTSNIKISNKLLSKPMKYWITQTGEKLKVKEMTTQHIENCIRMLQRHIATKPEPSYYMGISDYGEEWVEMENRQNDEQEEMFISWINSFKRELKKR